MAVNIQSSGVTRGSGEGGRTAPGDTRLKLFLAEFSVYFLNSATKNNFSVGCHPLEGVSRGGKETTAKVSAEALTKKGHQFFGRKK